MGDQLIKDKKMPYQMLISVASMGTIVRILKITSSVSWLHTFLLSVAIDVVR